VHSILNQLTAGVTNKQNLPTNNKLFRAFLQNAEKVLFMDAHLEFDGMVKISSTLHFKPRNS
ncbi:MAG: hypothetical protein ACK56I_21680, partial [bacterium]